MRVLIIGGGIGGLCLAQGLRKAGLDDVAVYERDPSPRGRMQGYRLRISPEGEQALRDCLVPSLQDLLTATSNERRSEGLQAFDEGLNPQWAPRFEDPRGDAPDKVDAVDRATLRRILLAGLEDVTHFGRRFTHCEETLSGRVVAYFADGGAVVGDVLVAADGANSAVRAQLRPADRTRDLGIRGILARTPRAAAIEAGLPEFLHDQFVYVIGTDGRHLGLMPMVFRTPPREAAERYWPDLEFDHSEDYYMSVFSMHKDALGLPDEEFMGLPGDRLREFALEHTQGWHPDLRGIWTHADVQETYPIALRAMVPVEPWEPGCVIPVGDAVHTMPPTGGAGANTAVRDAAVLCRELAAVGQDGRTVRDAAVAYQAEMVRYASDAVNMSLNIAKWSKQIEVEPEGSRQ